MRKRRRGTFEASQRADWECPASWDVLDYQRIEI